MRTSRRRAIALVLPLALLLAPLSLLACGGGATPEGAKAPGGPADAPRASTTAGTAGTAGTASAASAASAAVAADAGPTTTTTVALGNGGDLQGAKLSETHTVASTAPSGSAGAAAAPKGPHGREPGRAPEDIRAIIMAHRDEARACYDAALQGHPGIEGDLVIAWTIDPKGNVTQASADSSRSQIAEPSAIACISDIIKKIQFAASPGGYETKAYYPFNFHPHHGGAAKTPSP
jgi:hypothetical protein